MTYISLRRELRRSSDPLTYSCLIGKTDLISIPDRLYVGAFLTVDRSDRQLRSLRPTPTESEIRNLSLGPIPTGSLKSRSDRAREGRRDRPIANSARHDHLFQLQSPPFDEASPSNTTNEQQNQSSFLCNIPSNLRDIPTDE